MMDIISARITRKQATGWAIFIIMFGVFIPMSQASYWIKGTHLLSLHLIFVPLMITYACIAGSFARRSEGTFRDFPQISDRDLFIGKGLAGFVFSYLFYLFISLVGVLALNYVIYMNGEWRRFFVYSPPTLFAFVFCGAGFVLFAVGTGAYISLKVERVKTAQLYSSLFYLFIGAPVMAGLVRVVFTWDVVLAVFAVLFLVDAVAIGATLRMFKRSRLLCDVE